MPKRVYNNVVGHRVVDNERVAEDITSVTLPDVKHPTTPVDAEGMAMSVDMPNIAKLEAMELSIAHNNGINCRYLSNPGKHFLEIRVARQKYTVAAGELGHESMKFRITGIHKGTTKGNIETGNPYGSTEQYAVMRYEEEIDGEIVTIVDAAAGIIKFNGEDVLSPIESLLR